MAKLSLIIALIRVLEKMIGRAIPSMREVGRSLAKEHGDQLTKKSRNERLLAALDLLKKLGGSVALHETDGKKFIRGKSCLLAAITAHYPRRLSHRRGAAH